MSGNDSTLGRPLNDSSPLHNSSLDHRTGESYIRINRHASKQADIEFIRGKRNRKEGGGRNFFLVLRFMFLCTGAGFRKLLIVHYSQ